MSQWNNSYVYNNQYNGSNTWNGDANGQYVNQQYYSTSQYPNNQYVNFSEFLTQMQSNGAVPSNPTNYSNVQYQNYPVSQYNYQSTPSTSGNQQGNFTYAPNIQNITSTENAYQNPSTHPQPSSSQTNSKSYNNEIVLKSNLTPTATEFVPKSSTAPALPSTVGESNIQGTSHTEPSSDYSNEPAPSSSNSNNNQSKSSETNWRERSSTLQPNKSTAFSDNNFKYNDSRTRNDNYRKQDSSRYKDREPNNYNTNRGNYEYHGRNHRGNNEYNKNLDHKTQRESGNKQNDSRNQEHNNQDYEASQGYDNQNYSNSSNNDRGQSKSNYKSKGKDSMTFYNSSISKASQDSRIGRGENSGRGDNSGRGKNWNGTQRLRAMEHNSNDDEQYAKSYTNHDETRYEKPKKESVASPARKNKHFPGDQTANTEMTQRERLSEQLDKGTLECLVCCERVKQTDSVWSCSNCYHVFHLRCIRKWGTSSLVEGKWRCPACQNTSSEVPSEYRCMCGAMRSPEYQRGASGAHTCGKSCARPRSCPHPCTLLCHPGPCPPCQATINKQCGCGAETRSVLCSSKLPQVCGRTCHRTLECGVHTCTKECHEGPCDSCTETVTQVCYCTAARSRSVACTGLGARWQCGDACSRVLGCGAHVCRQPCHAPPCQRCQLLPDNVVTCPCGKNKLDKDQRKSCTDPIPLCGNICAKPLPCGPIGDRHFCKMDCHEGPCPVCPDTTLLQCRCGHSSRDVPCSELPEMLNNVLCQKKCNKKLSCGRHRCRTECCAGGAHRCSVVCGRSLSCQLHRCDQLCHTGHCAPCPILSWEEVRCACGGTVALPPVRCGARAPACSLPCRAPRSCGHPALHACHPPPCPPCVVLTARHCHGGHEERKTIPCSQGEFSCGLPCGKPLPCGKHTCIKICHKGPCDTESCTQPCQEKRASCGHACAAACHAAGGGACPSAVPCRRAVRVTCACGRRDAVRTCHENAAKARMLSAALAATKIQEGDSVDLSEATRPANMLKTLECDDSCRVEARTRSMALALQIRNPDVSAKLAPRYSEHCRATALRDPNLADHVHEMLTQLVQRAKKSKQKTRSHSFPSMNRQKRQFIHEMCEHFGCESVAYDAEPNRNVVATADREKSWLPAMSLMEVVNGRRRIPPPALRCAAPASSNKSGSGWATLTSTNAWAARSQPPKPVEPAEPPKIDYFDNPPDN